MDNLRKYIHYGSNSFDGTLHDCKAIHSKPDKGLWASPVDTTWGWKDWCESEEYYKTDFSKSFEFTLTQDAKILEIHKEEDILPYIIKDQTFPNMFGCLTNITDALDDDKLYNEFDGIELFLSENYDMHYGIFYSWDCDSIVVWNPEVINII